MITVRLAVGAGALAALLQMVALAKPVAILDSAQSDYVEHCGGCHGIQGTSVPARVPELRGRVGYFLCTEESRAYLLRLPNVAQVSLDDERLAAMMNFVVFDIGGASTDTASRRFTPEEVGRQRKRALTGESLTNMRATLVRQMQKRCRIPSRSLEF